MIHKGLLAVAIGGVVLGSTAVVFGGKNALALGHNLQTAGFEVSRLAEVFEKPTSKAKISGKGSVLAASDDLTAAQNDIHFEVNVPAVFNEPVTIHGALIAANFRATNLNVQTLVATRSVIAPNLLYSLAVSGSGLTITGDQELLISNTDKGSDQKIWKTFEVGDDSVAAGSNTDTFEFAAGSNIGLSLDEDNKKLTISNTATVPTQVWSGSGTSVYLTTSTDSVGIGTESPSYKMHVVGTGYVSDTFGVGGATTLSSTLGVTGATSLNGNTTIGDATTDTITFTGRMASGNSLLPIVDLGSDLGSSSLRFNNIYAATINTNSTLSTAGQAVFTYEPTLTAYTQASVLINPTAPSANTFLLAVGAGGLQRAGIDAEGDLTLGYSSGVSAPNSAYPLSIYGHNSTQVAYIDTSGNLNLSGTASISGTTTVGSAIQPATGNLTFNYKSGANAWTAGLTMDTVGNIGIGTTTPRDAIELTTGKNVRLAQSGGSGGRINFMDDAGTAVGGNIWSGDGGFRIQTGTSAALNFFLTRSDTPYFNISYDTVRTTFDNYGSTNPFNFADKVGINNLTASATLDVRALSGTTPVASFSGQTAHAALVVDNSGLGDIFTASSSGLTRFVVNQQGRVGIGTSTPVDSLHIVGSTNINSTSYGLKVLTDAYNSTGKNVRFADIGESYYLDIGGFEGAVLRYNSAIAHRFATSGVDTVYLGSTTVDGGLTYASLSVVPYTAATVGLMVQGKASQTADLVNIQNSAFTKLFKIDSTGKVGVGTGTNTALATLDARGLSGTLAVASISGQTAFATMVVDNSGLGDIFTASSSGLNRFVVNQQGKVGIGTNLPDGHLTIESAIDPTLIFRSTSANTSNAEPRIKFYEQSNLWWDIYMDGGSNNQLVFSTDGSTTNAAFTLLNANAVGAGDWHPDAHLEVSANGTTGGDVFLVSSNDDLDGDLLTLEEIGELGIGQTSPDTKLHVGSSSVTDGTNLLKLQDANSSCTFTADAGASTCGSDITLKKDVASLDTGSLLERVTNLRPVAYHWKTEDVHAPLQHGFIAQEVAEQFPDLVKDGTWIDGTTRKFLSMGGLMPYVIGAVKEQQLQINQLALANGLVLGVSTTDGGNLDLTESFAETQEQVTEQNTLISEIKTQVLVLIADLQNLKTLVADLVVRVAKLEEDQTGTLTLPKGTLSAKMSFAKPFTSKPVVILTPQGTVASVSLTEVTESSFTLTLSAPQDVDTVVNWSASVSRETETEHPTLEILTSQPAPQPSPTVTPSPTPVATDSATVLN